MLEGRKRKLVCSGRRRKSHSSVVKSTENSGLLSPNGDNIMTQKPIRIRRQRIPVLQSGYCAICNLPYNSIEDHIQSKKHQKLIGDDTNYISLNGCVGIESLLSLTGIEAIGLDDFSPKAKRRSMPRTRTTSVMSDAIKPRKLMQENKGHRLRSRRSLNFTTSNSEEEENSKIEKPVRLEYKEYRELRSSTRALAKLTSCATEDNEQKYWESGRPKRSCNNSKRPSADERLVNDNKTYYKVEVLSNKLRSSDREKLNKVKEAKQEETDKALIVKFKKLRTSELVQLNNEATNFLFPKREEDIEEDGMGQKASKEVKKEKIKENGAAAGKTITDTEDVKPPDKVKVEDETSVDSSSSDCKTRKKRRTQAEAFIMDNEKYYKFETPGSRLRYHGSYLPPLPATKTNGDLSRANVKTEQEDEEKNESIEVIKEEETQPVVTNDVDEESQSSSVDLNDFVFSFEMMPKNEAWYQTFKRQDQAEQSYHFTPNYYWNDFVMPYNIPHLKPLDPRICYNAYKQLKDNILQAESEASTSKVCDKIEKSTTNNLSSKGKLEQAENVNKLSDSSSASLGNVSEINDIGKKNTARKKGQEESSSTSPRGRNARKSPRQHASTLAIMSNLQQRKRRSKTPRASCLETIPEESPAASMASAELKQRKKKVDCLSVAAKINEELSIAFKDDDDDDFQPTTEPDIHLLENKLTIDDILTMYDESTAREKENRCRRFINGLPGRKPGKRKKNLTGWPNKKKRKIVKSDNGECNSHEQSDDDDDDGEDDDEEAGEENNIDSATVDKEVKCSSEIRDNQLEPYVLVKKLNQCNVKEEDNKVKSVRTVKKLPKKEVNSVNSRILRKPKA